MEGREGVRMRGLFVCRSIYQGFFLYPGTNRVSVLDPLVNHYFFLGNNNITLSKLFSNWLCCLYSCWVMFLYYERDQQELGLRSDLQTGFMSLIFCWLLSLVSVFGSVVEFRFQSSVIYTENEWRIIPALGLKCQHVTASQALVKVSHLRKAWFDGREWLLLFEAALPSLHVCCLHLRLL